MVTGFTGTESDQLDALLLKYDSDGNLLWQKSYGETNEDRMTDLCQTEDGAYVLTGSTKSFGAIARDLYLIKTDENGDTVWTKTYGGSDDQWGRGIDKLPDGGVIVAGWTGTFLSASDIWLLRLDTDGDTLWTKTYNYGDWDMANRVIRTFNGGFLMSGKADGRFLVMKTSSDGSIQWINNAINYSVASGIVQNTEGDYVVSGQHNPTIIPTEGILQKIKGEHVNQAPGDFLLLLPEDEDTLTNVIDPVEFVWETSFDPDDDNIYYTFKIFNRDTIITIGFISDTTYSFDGSEFFEENEPYDWTVSASDGQILVHADTFAFVTPLIIGIDDVIDEPKPAVTLSQNYPNPFSRETTIKFSLNEPMPVTLEIFNLQGQKVKTLVSGNLPAGNHQIKWNGTNALGNKSVKGIYTYRLSTDGFTRTFKMFYTR